jgi:hypothetical protein
VALSAQATYRYDKARFKASLSAVSFAKREAYQRADQPQAPFSMASLKRRYVKQHLVDRVVDPCATESRLEKFSTVYEELCNYGTIADMAASILSAVLLM